jgi:hypothetical protein
LRIFAVAVIVFLINMPFGYWRGSVKKLSFKWFLAVHLPVPLVVLVRIYSNIGFQLITYPVIVGAFFFGQYAGARLYKSRSVKRALPAKENE